MCRKVDDIKWNIFDDETKQLSYALPEGLKNIYTIIYVRAGYTTQTAIDRLSTYDYIVHHVKMISDFELKDSEVHEGGKYENIVNIIFK